MNIDKDIKIDGFEGEKIKCSKFTEKVGKDIIDYKTFLQFFQVFRFRFQLLVGCGGGKGAKNKTLFLAFTHFFFFKSHHSHQVRLIVMMGLLFFSYTSRT